MTEAEWLACDDPGRLLLHFREEVVRQLGGGPPRVPGLFRRLRLFACACFRRRFPAVTMPRVVHVVDVAERYAEGEANDGEREAAHAGLRYLLWRDSVVTPFTPRFRALVSAAVLASRAGESDRNLWVKAYHFASKSRLEARAAAEGLVRDLFGNPFRPPIKVRPEWPSWNGGTVRHLAQSAYEERHLPCGGLEASRLAVVADALEEAGCDETGLLTHLRGPGPHIRGC